jgi:hypothetical protein
MRIGDDSADRTRLRQDGDDEWNDRDAIVSRGFVTVFQCLPCPSLGVYMMARAASKISRPLAARKDRMVMPNARSHFNSTLAIFLEARYQAK